jgi:hypothetical protein
MTILTHPKWYEDVHILSDVFSEHQRLMARKKYSKETPLEYWQKNAFKMIKDALVRVASLPHKSPGKIDAYQLRENMYHSKHKLQECETFKSSLAYLVFTKLFPGTTHILDFCSGWGDRLIAAIATNLKYTGIDPNSKLVEVYRQIIETYCPEDRRQDYRMISSCFLSCDALNEPQFDLVFTCPPYYDLELYSDEKTQSVEQYPTLEDWKHKFLFACIKKAWNLLLPLGSMVIVLNDFSHAFQEADRCQYVEDMILFATQELSDCEFSGVVSYANGDEKLKSWGIRQPMWIFKKKMRIQLTVEEKQVLGLIPFPVSEDDTWQAYFQKQSKRQKTS